MIQEKTEMQSKFSLESLYKYIKKIGFKIKKGNDEIEKLLTKINSLIDNGYDFNKAEASLLVLIVDELAGKSLLFETLSVRVLDLKNDETGEVALETTVKVKVKGRVHYSVTEGTGHVRSIFDALIEALSEEYTSIKALRILDFNVEALCDHLKVNVRLTDGIDSWTTVGISRNLVEAVWEAIKAGLKYELIKNHRKLKEKTQRRIEEKQVEVLSMMY